MIASERALTTAGSGAGAGAGAGAGGAFGAGTGGAGPDPDRATCRDPACASCANARLPSARCNAWTRLTGVVAADSAGAARAGGSSRTVRCPVTPSGAMSGCSHREATPRAERVEPSLRNVPVRTATRPLGSTGLTSVTRVDRVLPASGGQRGDSRQRPGGRPAPYTLEQPGGTASPPVGTSRKMRPTACPSPAASWSGP